MKLAMWRVSLCLSIVAAGGCVSGAQMPPSVQPRALTQNGPPGQVDAVALSADGRFLAVTGGGSTQVWDVPARELRRVLRGGGEPAWSRDGTRLAVAGNGLRLWKMPEATLVRYDVAGSAGVAFSGDSRTLICGDRAQEEESYAARILSSDDGRLLRRLTDGESYYNGYIRPLLSYDGSLALTYVGRDYDRTAQKTTRAWLWRTGDGRLLRGIDDTLAVWSADFSPDNRWIALGQDKNTLSLWSVRDGTLRRLLDTSPDAYRSVLGVRFSADGKSLLGSTGDRTMCRWRMPEGDLSGTFTLPQGCDAHYIHAADDLRTLAVRDLRANVAIVDGSGNPLWRLPPAPPAVSAIAWSRDGGLLAYNAGSNLWLWDTRSGKLRASPSALGTVTSLRIGGGYLSAALMRVEGDRAYTDIWTWNADDGLLAGTRTAPEARFSRLSPDGRWLVDAFLYSPELVLYDATTGRRARRLKPDDQVTSVAFSPDGRMATAERNETVRVWDAHRGTQRIVHARRPLGNDFSANALAFSGRWIAGGGYNGARLWSATGPPAEWLLDTARHSVDVLAFSADQTRLAAGSNDGSVLLWTVDPTARQVPPRRAVKLGNHDAPVRSIAFSPDGRMLATGGADGALRLWDISLVSAGATKLIGTIHNFENAGEWLIQTPAGDYASSNGAGQWARWQTGAPIDVPLATRSVKPAMPPDELMRALLRRADKETIK